MDTTDTSQAVPVITTDFHSLEDLGWYGSSYQIARYALNLLTQTTLTKKSNQCMLATFDRQSLHQF